MVVFSNIQFDNFFTNNPKMNLPVNVSEQLSQEGLTEMTGFDNFRDDKLKAFFQEYENINSRITSIYTSPKYRLIYSDRRITSHSWNSTMFDFSKVCTLIEDCFQGLSLL